MNEEVTLQRVGFRTEICFQNGGWSNICFQTEELPDRLTIMRFIVERMTAPRLIYWVNDAEEFEKTFEVTIYERYNLKEKIQKNDFRIKLKEFQFTAQDIIEELPEYRLLYATGQL